MFPSVKTLSRVTDNPKLARKILLAKNREELEKIRETNEIFNGVSNWIGQCYNQPSFHHIKMEMLNAAIGTYGVEYIPAGKNKRSPAIEYCNSGDTYTTTILFVNGSYRVGCWGDIVEKGNYE